MTDNIASVRPAATVIVLRPSDNGDDFEVLMLQRNSTLSFASNQWVFPGGKVEAEDAGTAACDLQAAKHAAAREAHEEAGITLSPDSFAFFAHFTTPSHEKNRFATWFLIGALPKHQRITIDDSEIVNYQWLTPQAALALHRRGELDMLPPTYWSLFKLQAADSIDRIMNHSIEREAVQDVPHFCPKMTKQGERLQVILEGDSDYNALSSGAAVNPQILADIDRKGSKQRFIRTAQGWQFIEQDA